MRREDETVVCEAASIREAVTDLRTLVRERFAAWSSERRERLLSGLSCLDLGDLSPSLSDGLFTVREALRERQPLSVLAPGVERVVQVEWIDRIDENGFYLRGWWWETSAPVSRLDAISPEGERVAILDTSHHHARPDAGQRLGVRDGARDPDARGFISHFSTTAPSRRLEGWVVELVNANGRGVETSTALRSAPPEEAEDVILADLRYAGGDRDALMEQHTRPALTQLRAACRGRVAPASCDQHGAAPRNPALSIIVALDQRIELLEHQLAQFADDPDLHGCELVYVGRHPEDSDRLRELARGLFELYGLPMRVITLAAVADPALALDLGAAGASAPRLLLLGAAMIPDRRGWLGRMRRFHEATPGIGALTPKLLYEDGIINQAGVEFVATTPEGEWQLRPRFRGLERRLPAANVARPVVAASPECVMVGTQPFAELGGLSADYLTSEHAGADLCLRLADLELENWYLPQVELYRLDDGRGSPDADEARSSHDRWVLSRRHGRALGDSPGQRGQARSSPAGAERGLASPSL